MPMNSSRRQFLTGCSAAIAAMAGSRLGYVALGNAATASSNREVIIIVFLRGGMDGLSLLPPISGEDRGHYETARPALRIPLSGAGASLPLSDTFGLHPAGAPLLPLFQSGKLAIVHAVGNSGSRSHFDAMKYIELGTPGSQSLTTGWLTRHLLTAPGLGSSILAPALTTGVTPPTSLQGSIETLQLDNPGSLNLSEVGHWSWVISDQRIALRRMYQQGSSFAHDAGLQALDSASIIENYVTTAYTPTAGVTYPETDFGRHLKLVAQMVKLEVGLRVATIDLGGWDTHENQGINPGGQFHNLLTILSNGLASFYADLDTSAADAPIKRVTVVVQSEFGRRIRENARNGTDHGTGNPLLILGGNVRGGFHGTFPGLHPDLRFDGADLNPTTDFRQILSEILIRRLGNPNLGVVFPKYQGYSPINLVSGNDLAPNYDVPVPAVPVGLSATLASGIVRLTWSTVPNATGYRIQRRRDATAPWDHLITLGPAASSHEDAAPPATSGYAYRIQSFSSYGESAFGDPVSPAAVSALDAWRLKHFNTTSNTGEAADDRILTEDGLTNFTKYALGLDPYVPAPSASGFTPGKPQTELQGGTLSLVYVRPTDRPDVNYEVRTSLDLKNWTPIPDVSEGTSNGLDRRRASVVVGDKTAQFLTLRVSRRDAAARHGTTRPRS